MHQCSLSPPGDSTIGTYLDTEASAIRRGPEEA